MAEASGKGLAFAVIGDPLFGAAIALAALPDTGLAAASAAHWLERVDSVSVNLDRPRPSPFSVDTRFTRRSGDVPPAEDWRAWRPSEEGARLRVRGSRPAVLEPGPRPLLLALNTGEPSFEARPSP